MSQHKLEVYFFFALFAGVLAISFFIFYPYLFALILAIIFAIIFKPLYHNVRSVMGRKEGLAAFITIVVVSITVLIPLVLIGMQIFREAQDLYTYLTVGDGKVAIFTNIENYLNTFIQNVFPEKIKPINLSLAFDFDSYVKDGLDWLFRNVGSLLSSVTGMTLNFLIFLFAFYYLLKDGDGFRKKLIKLSPLPDKYDEEISNKLEVAVNSIIRGSITVALIQGFLTGIGFYLFGIPSPAFWGAVAAIASFVPALGTAIVTAPAVIFLFVSGNTLNGIGLAIWGTTAVGLIDNFIGPKLIQRGTKLHSFLVLLFALGGLSMFGPMGFFLGPIILSLLFALIDIYELISREV